MTTYSKIILTKSGVEQAAPTAGDLDLGELAINYNDGKLFFKDGIDSIRVIGSSGSIISAAAHQDNKSNPHEVNKTQVGLSNVDNTADSAKEVSGPQQSALNLKANQSDTYNKIEVDNLISTQTGSDITLTDLSMGPVADASGTGGVTYDNLTGVFTYIPPALSDLGGLLASDISVTQLAGEGAEAGTLLYDGDGEFTFKKPTLAGLGGQPSSAILDDLDTLGTVTGEDRFIVSTGDGVFAYQTGSTVRDSLGLGASDTPEFNGIDLDGGDLVLDTVGNIKVITTGGPNQIDFNFDDGDSASESKLSISYSQTADAGGAILPTTTNDIDLGSATNEFKDLYIDGTANIDTLSADNATIDNINIDGNTISSTNTDGDINIIPNGAGKTIVDGQLNATSFKLNGGGVVDLFQKFQSTQDFGEIAADSFSETIFTATGVSVGDFIFTATPPNQDQHLLSTARCTADDEITLRVYNMDNQAITPTSDTWYFLAVSFL